MFPSPFGRAARLAAAIAVSLASSASAQQDDEEERLRLEAELQAELAPPPPSSTASPGLPVDLSAVGTFLGSYFTDAPTPRPAGHEPAHRGFALQEIELALQSNLDPYFRADVFLAVSLHGIEVEEAYVTTMQLPWNLQLRAGSFYSPFGRLNQQHFLETTPFVDLPLPNRRFFGGEQLRGMGLEASVLLPLPFYLELRAALQTAENEVSFGVPATEIDEAHDLLAVARVLSSFDLAERLTLNLGASLANGPNGSGGLALTDENRTDVFGADLYLRLRDRSSVAFTALHAEWMFRRATVPDGRLEQGGAFVWLVRRFDERLEAAIRADLLGLPDGSSHGAPFEVVSQFLEPTKQRRLGASLSWHFTEFTRLRLQGNRDFGLGDRDPVTELFLQFQFAMGAHGAHAF